MLVFLYQPNEFKRNNTIQYNNNKKCNIQQGIRISNSQYLVGMVFIYRYSSFTNGCYDIVVRY